MDSYLMEGDCFTTVSGIGEDFYRAWGIDFVEFLQTTISGGDLPLSGPPHEREVVDGKSLFRFIDCAFLSSSCS